MKKILFAGALLIIPLFLSGCFGSSAKTDTVTKAPEGFRISSGDQFTLQIPNGWETLNSQNFPSGTPQNTVIAFRDNVKNAAFTPVVAVVKNNLATEESSIDYAKALYQKSSAELASFREIQVEETSIAVGASATKTLFAYFEGRQTADADPKRFIQISGVKGKTAYIVLGAFLASDETTAKKIETAVRSFTVK